MAEIYDITVENLRSYCQQLKVGDKLLLSGYIFTARDAAHKRFNALLEENKPLPINIRDAVIYYAGPTLLPTENRLAHAGPQRLDEWTFMLLVCLI